LTVDQTQHWILPKGRPPARWRFGRIEFDERSAAMSVDGVPAVLDRSGYEILRRLLHDAGQVVSKEQLLQAGWPGRVVTENSLAKAISRLRQLIGDADGDVLRVVHGYGYRLSASIECEPDQDPAAATVEAAGAAAGAAPMNVEISPRRRRLMVRWLLSALALAAAIVTGSLMRPPAVAPPSADSIAVLPFADLSAAHDQQYFSDGLADELLTALARMPQLRVVGRTASFAYRDRTGDVQAIGNALHAATILEGSVRKSGDRIRVTVQLLKAADGYHLWSQTYDRPVTELFAMQDEIVRAIAGALRIELLPGQDRELVRHRTSSAAAYEEYLLATAVFKDDETAHRRSLAHLERAVALDPQFVDAWLGLADLLGYTGLYADDAGEALAGKRRALAILDHVIELAPQRWEPYLGRGIVRYAHWWDWAGADADFVRAATLGGADDPHRLVEVARLRAATGDLRAALSVLERLTQTEPQSTTAWTVMGYHYTALGSYERARDALEQAVRVDPLDEHARYYLGLGELLQGHAAAALPHFEDSAHVLRLTGLAMAHHSLGDADASDKDLQLLITRYGHILPYNAADVYAWRGENDRAFEWLERAYELHDASFMYLEFDPLLRGLHADARFAALLARLKLPPLAVATR
jgi:TolB-like protein/DNA-binding winged helix-turn-helix (wHTH) protein/predicted Zn-dependent protease